MKDILRAFAYFLALLMTACAGVPPHAGETYTAPIVKQVSSAQGHLKNAVPVIDTVVQSGAKPQDKNVIAADKEVHQAQKDLAAVPAYVTTVNAVIDKAAQTITSQNQLIKEKNHRIFIDDLIFGIPVLLLAAFIGVKVAKFAVLL